MTLKIAVINQSTRLTQERSRKAVAAINRQLKEHFFPAWHIAARCKLVSPKVDVKKLTDECLMLIQDHATDDALGYHDKVLGTGKPYGYVFLDTSKDLDEAWTVTLSHEVLELVLNPVTNFHAIGRHPKEARTVAHWLEACDAVQDQTYTIDRVEVSDFLLPLYFTPEREKGANNDYLGKRLDSLGLTPGGYQGFFDPKTGKDETVFADKRAREREAIKSQLGTLRRSKRRPSLCIK